MAIDRVVKKTQLAPGLVRYRVIVTGEECPPNTNEARAHQGMFLSWLAENQHMTVCGYEPFRRLVITHNGTCWVAEAEAEVEEQDPA